MRATTGIHVVARSILVLLECALLSLVAFLLGSSSSGYSSSQRVVVDLLATTLVARILFCVILSTRMIEEGNEAVPEGADLGGRRRYGF